MGRTAYVRSPQNLRTLELAPPGVARSIEVLVDPKLLPELT
jgi:hypothetical protein